MRLHICLKVGLILVLIAALNNTGAYSQSSSYVQEESLKSQRFVSMETYNRVLDILFPRGDSSFFAIVLRFEPNFEAESQIVIMKKGLNKSEVIETTSLSGNIHSKLNDILAHGGKEDAIEMAKLIKVKKRTIVVPYSRVKEWHDAFLRSVGESTRTFKEKLDEDDTGTSSMALDGTYYDIWYNQIHHEMSFRFYDQAIEVPRLIGEFKLVQWMNIVRVEIARMK